MQELEKAAMMTDAGGVRLAALELARFTTNGWSVTVSRETVAATVSPSVTKGV